MGDTDQMNGGVPAPPTPQPPAPPAGAMNKGVTGADPASDPAQQLMAEATRLGGPLGGIAIGAATGAAHHVNQQDQQNQAPAPIDKTNPAQVMKDPDFLARSSDAKRIILSKIDPQFVALSPMAQQKVLDRLTPSPESDMTNMGNILGEQYLTPEAQNEANPKMAPLAKAETVGLLAGPLSAGASALAGGGIAGSTLAGAAAGTVQGGADVVPEIGEHLAAGENPFRLQMAGHIAKEAAIGAGTGAVLHGAAVGAGKVVGGAINKAKSMYNPSAAEMPNYLTASEAEQAGNLGPVTEAHFQEIPKDETPQLFPHGKPVVGDQPFTNSVIASMRQGRSLGTEEANLLKQYVGDVVPHGSTPMNTAMRAVEPVNEAITRLGTEMQKAIQNAPEFAQSAIEDPNIGTSLIEDTQAMKENLPGGPSSPQSKVIEREMAAAHDALITKDPQELLTARRKLGQKIGDDWADITKNPDTDKEVQLTARARIYQALTTKLKQVEGVAKIDEEYQPNLELKGWLNKVLPEGVADDVLEANAQQAYEHKQGLRKLAIDAHNDRIEQNVKLAEKAIAAHKERIANNWKTAAAAASVLAGGKLLINAAEHGSAPSIPTTVAP